MRALFLTEDGSPDLTSSVLTIAMPIIALIGIGGCVGLGIAWACSHYAGL